VLKDGSVPLDVLDAKIDRWIKAQQAATPTPTATPASKATPTPTQ
jgi:hypothetical protein